jgi:hypothetical protein
MSANDLAASACAARNSEAPVLPHRTIHPARGSPERVAAEVERTVAESEKSKGLGAAFRGSDQDGLSRPAQAEDGSVPPTEAALFFRGGLPCPGQSPKLDCYVGGANCEPARDCAGSVSRVSVHHWSIEP